MKNNLMPPNLMSSLQEVLTRRKDGDESAEPTSSSSPTKADDDLNEDPNDGKPIILVTNGEGIESPGLTYLVEALVKEGKYNVNVCAPQSDKSASGYSITIQDTVVVSCTEVSEARAYEVSGTPVDCVSLALSGALFSWSKPLLVVSGINRGSSCGHHMFYSGVVAGAREALINGVPSISISLNWKKDESQENDLKEAATVCLPIITAAVRDIENGVFPKSCHCLNVDIPTSPSNNKGFKVTKQSLWRSSPTWQAAASSRSKHPSGGLYMGNQQSLGLQLAQLSRDASAAGAARNSTTHKKNVEVESVGAAGKRDDKNRDVKKYFRLEFINKDLNVEDDDDLDIKALESGFVAITPVSLSCTTEPDIRTSVADWVSTCIGESH